MTLVGNGNRVLVTAVQENLYGQALWKVEAKCPFKRHVRVSHYFNSESAALLEAERMAIELDRAADSFRSAESIWEGAVMELTKASDDDLLTEWKSKR